jgi:hypothetical protein
VEKGSKLAVEETKASKKRKLFVYLTPMRESTTDNKRAAAKSQPKVNFKLNDKYYGGAYHQLKM